MLVLSCVHKYFLNLYRNILFVGAGKLSSNEYEMWHNSILGQESHIKYWNMIIWVANLLCFQLSGRVRTLSNIIITWLFRLKLEAYYTSHLVIDNNNLILIIQILRKHCTDYFTNGIKYGLAIFLLGVDLAVPEYLED